MIVNLEKLGIAAVGANQSTPMISYAGQKTIQNMHALSKRNINQLPSRYNSDYNSNRKFYTDSEERKQAQNKPVEKVVKPNFMFNVLNAQ